MTFSFSHISRLPRRNILLAAICLFVLSFATSYYFNEIPSINSDVSKLERYVQRQEREFDVLVQDTLLMRKLVQKQETLTEFKNISGKNFGFFLYAETLSDQHELLFWNNQRIQPGPSDLSLTEGEYFQRLSNGYYVVIKKRIKLSGMSNYVLAYALIPIFYNYSIESSYLPKQFAHDEDATKKISLSDVQTEYVIQSITNKPLFYVARRAHTTIQSSDSVTLLLRIGGLVLLLSYLQYIAVLISLRWGAVRGTLFIGFVLLLTRSLLFVFPEIFNLKQFQLFDPTVYSSNWINRSLGDLLLNAILFCWITVFAWHNMGPIKRVPHLLRGKRIYIAAVLGLFFLIISTFELANMIRSLVADSRISFNVINFFSLNIYSLIGFIVLALISLTYYYFTRIFFRFIFLAFDKKPIYVYFIIAVVGLFYLTLQTGNAIVLFYIPVLIWLVIYTLLVSQEQFIINHFKITMAGVLFWIFVFSVSLAVLLLQENKKKERIERIDIAEKRDELTDPSQERTLSIGLAYLDNDFLVYNFPRFSEASSQLRDSIINQNSFVSYRNTYNTKMYVFDSSNAGLYGDEDRSYLDLENIFSARSKPTNTPDLHYYETSLNDLFYITRKVIVADTNRLGTFFIISTPRKYISEGFLPELFRRSEMDLEEQMYSHATYRNKVLISASNKYPFQTFLTDQEVPKSEFEYRLNGEYDELWYRAANEKTVVVARKQDSLIESITLFSYLFCAFLLMVAIMQLYAYMLHPAHGWRISNIFSQLSIRSQVHGTIIFVSILSFLIIGAATISFFISRYNRNNVDRLSRTSDIMVREMQKRIKEQGAFDDVLKIYDSVSNTNLQKLVQEVSDIHNLDVNVYDLEGNLKVSSSPIFYKWGVLSNKIHPGAFYHLSRMRKVQHVQEETLSSLHYLSIYAAVRDETGKVDAYLNVPYFLSQIDLNQEISNFLVTIINLNAFIFLISGVIALFITNRITRSFSIIGDKMKEVQLGKTNEEIEWNYKDEIGELVQQYNKMVHQLEQSAQALAKSEREGAWREMARQVAHEIKNPLTPMKLSIQYLQKAINNNHSNVKELTSNVANTLIEQIDHLSKIAADFSRFANIGNKQVERFDLHYILASLVDLYQANPKIDLVWNKTAIPLFMQADRTHMNRLFTNLLTNAVDACADKEECSIEIKEEIRNNQVLISIRDNGEGIAAETQAKIFVPNFTTKTSGTGLGLAMCKSIVEQANGEIWFETELGEGSVFYVSLPLA